VNTSEAARLMRATMAATVEGDAGGEVFDKEIAAFSIDSRSLEGGELFFALSPEDYARHGFTGTSFADAHQFIPQAFESGALAAVARRERVAGDASLAPYKGRLLLVEDCIEALQVLAHSVLSSWGQPVVGITGSAGKTTTKDMTAHVLGVNGRRVLRSRKNFNNELGLPLSILQMETAGAKPSDYDVAVLEMGMSTPKELARLCEIAPPDIAVELLVAPVHLEFFGSIERIAASKAQLVEGLKPGGTAVLNADDERVAAMRDKHRSGPVVTFGITNAADVTASDIVNVGLGLTRFRLLTPLGEASVELPMPGRHNLMNALAASAVATCFNLAPEQIGAALKTVAASEMRGEVLRFSEGFVVVDDSYNSNPRSLLSMSEALAQGSEETKRRIIVAGEMLELGPEAAAMHREAGREIGNLGVELFWGVRGLASELIAGAREAGMHEDATRFFESSEDAAAALASEIRAGDLVLVKGSRGVQTDKVVKFLRQRYEMKDE
jgi:UDP-N-acetylmuramoyl-tripeptide--D-alanyl-D-alanine ligase